MEGFKSSNLKLHTWKEQGTSTSMTRCPQIPLKAEAKWGRTDTDIIIGGQTSAENVPLADRKSVWKRMNWKSKERLIVQGKDQGLNTKALIYQPCMVSGEDPGRNISIQQLSNGIYKRCICCQFQCKTDVAQINPQYKSCFRGVVLPLLQHGHTEDGQQIMLTSLGSRAGPHLNNTSFSQALK